jgi:hypothetical protein
MVQKVWEVAGVAFWLSLLADVAILYIGFDSALHTEPFEQGNQPTVHHREPGVTPNWAGLESCHGLLLQS